MKVDSGVAVCARTVHDEALSVYAGRLVDVLGLRGPVNVQFRRDTHGVPRLLEINPRFPGTVPLTIAAGLDLPRLAVADLLGLPVEMPSSFTEVAVVRTWQEHYVSVDAFSRVSENSEVTPSAA